MPVSTITKFNIGYRYLKSLNENRLEPKVFHLKPKLTDNKLFRTVTGNLPSFLRWYGALIFGVSINMNN